MDALERLEHIERLVANNVFIIEFHYREQSADAAMDRTASLVAEYRESEEAFWDETNNKEYWQ